MSKTKQNDLVVGILKGVWFRRVWNVIVCFLVLYVFAVTLIMLPTVQRRAIYKTHVHAKGYHKFEHPERYGMAPGKTVNLKLKSSDNTTIGAWFVFADSFYRKLPYPPPDRIGDFPISRKQLVSSALSQAPTVLYLHGNTATRAHHKRTSFYSAITSRLGANVMAVDYRGFGDSEGHPTVQGVSKDARAAWDYLIRRGAKPEDILILGHSLGTAIAGILTAELGKEGIEPRGTVLTSPFSSVRKLIDHYNLFGFLPLLKPLSMIPLAPRLITWSLRHRFDTLSLVSEIKTNVLIAHADDDWDIPSFHSTILFDAFLDPHLPSPASLPENPLSAKEWDNFTRQDDLRASKRSELVSTTVIDGFGLYEEMRPQLVAEEGRKVVLLKLESGGHNIGRIEGLQDVIGKMFGFY